MPAPSRPATFRARIGSGRVVRKFGSNYCHVALAAFIVNMLALAAPLFTMNVYDRVVPNGAIPSLVALAIGLGLAIVFDFIIRIVRAASST